MVLGLLMILMYVKSAKNIFKSPKKMVKEFKEQTQIGFKTNGKLETQIALLIGSVIFLLITTAYYVITASVTGSMIMIVIASVIVFRNIVSAYRMLEYVFETKDDYRVNWLDKALSLVGIGYLVAFFVLYLFKF